MKETHSLTNLTEGLKRFTENILNELSPNKRLFKIPLDKRTRILQVKEFNQKQGGALK